MKLLILGYGRHGKDTLAEIFRDEFGITFSSSSYAACELVVFPALKDEYDYDTSDECYQDRADHRQEWYKLISDYNAEDPSRLCRDILYGVEPLSPESGSSTSSSRGAKGNDCYVGLRSKRELEGSRHLFDLIIFVDAQLRHPIEGKESCTITSRDADVIITNNGSLPDFRRKAINLGSNIFGSIRN